MAVVHNVLSSAKNSLFCSAKEVTSHVEMELEESLSMARNLLYGPSKPATAHTIYVPV